VVPSNNYAFYLSGLEAIGNQIDGPNFYALAGSVTIDANGNVLGGEQDYNDGFGLTSPEPSGDTITGGKLTVNATTGQGKLTLITNNRNLGASGTETLGVQFVNAKHALIVQFDGSATSSGSMDFQTLPSTLSGGYAFTLSGVDTGYFPLVAGGVFSISGTTLQNGFVDINDNGTVTLKTPFTGTISAPDSFGRGTITGTLIATTFNYYIVGPEAIRIIDVDPSASGVNSDSGVGSAYGQGTDTFSDAALGPSVFGVESNSAGSLYAAAGMFTVPASGTFQGVADDNELGNGVVVPDSSISGIYSIASNGYGSLTIKSGDLGHVSALGIYLTDPNLNLNDPNNRTGGGGALVADLDPLVNGTGVGTGVLIPQTDTSTASFAGNYAFGAQEYNYDNFWEFDFVGQGSVSSPGGVLTLTGTGPVSDPGGLFDSGTAEETGATFSGTPLADTTNVGRYTLLRTNPTPNPLAITVGDNSAVPFNVVIYQASGGQLFWLNEDYDQASDNFYSVFLGSLQQQGSLTGLPAAKRGLAKSANRNRNNNQ